MTVSADKINFIKSVPAGTIIELIGRITHIGNTSIQVTVEIHVGEMYSFERHQAIYGSFAFALIDEIKQLICIL